jgi:hypothetical protein
LVRQISVLRITAQEPSRARVVVSGAEVVEAEVGIVLFAAIQVVVGRCASGVDLVSEGVAIVGVRDS